MVGDEQEDLLQQLTGIQSSKLNYYVEFKKRNEEILRQHSRLETLHQLTRDINIDMSIEDILEHAFSRLPKALPCNFIALATLRGGQLFTQAMAPADFCTVEKVPRESIIWKAIASKEALVYDPVEQKDECFVRFNEAYPERLRSMVVAPLFERSAVSGVLLLGAYEQSAFGRAEINFVQHGADQLSISIQNSSLYKRVSRAQKEWEATFKAVTDPIFLIDTDYNVLQHNDRLPEKLKESWKNAVSNKCFARIQGFDAPCPDCPVDEIKRTGEPVHRLVQSQKGPLLDLTYYPVLNEESQVSAVTLFMKDVTEKTKMEAQLMHSAKLAAIGEMAAGVAHELNSPMTVIIGTAQMAIRDLQTEDRYEDAEILEDIVNCGLRCKRIIQNLLTFSRQDQVPMTDVDLNVEIERVLNLIQYQINRNQIRIVVKCDPELPKVTANGHQIQQVLTNFLVNARDAMNGGREEKVIEVSTSVRLDGEKRWAVISVRDSGIGIPEENLQKIFTPFFTSKEATKGTGLGLSVSLGIAEAHEGTIEVESEAGVGSTFSLVLPVE